jgi:hypothetical protein
VRITYEDDEGNTHVAEAFTTTSSIHGEYASYLGKGLDGFRFNLKTRGRAGPVNHFGLHGYTTGVEDGTYAATADGHANVKHADGAYNYLVETTGTAEFR